MELDLAGMILRKRFRLVQIKLILFCFHMIISKVK